MDFEPYGPSVDLFSAKLLHSHATFFRCSAPYAESHRANSLVFFLLRRLNSYQISRVLCAPGKVDARGSQVDRGGLTSCLSDSDYACLRSIIIAAVASRETSQSTLFQTPVQASFTSLDLSPQDSSLLASIGASVVHAYSSPSVAAGDNQTTKMTPITIYSRLSTSNVHTQTLFSMTGNNLLACRSHIVATLVATILPSNPRAKCLTAAMLLLHVVAGFCPHLFKPPSMSQPLGMINLANRAIVSVISSGSIGAIGQRLAPLTQALHDDQKLLVGTLIARTMQFLCDIFLTSMVRSRSCFRCVLGLNT